MIAGRFALNKKDDIFMKKYLTIEYIFNYNTVEQQFNRKGEFICRKMSIYATAISYTVT